MKLWTRVLAFEFRQTAANKAFVIMTILGPFLILAIGLLPSLLAQSGAGESEKRIGIATADQAVFAELESALESGGIQVDPIEVDEAQTQVRNGEINGALVLPDDWVDAETLSFWHATGTDVRLSLTVEATIQNLISRHRLAEAGVDDEAIGRILNPPRLETRKPVESPVSPKSEPEADAASSGAAGDFIGTFAVVMGFVMMLFMTILLYGQMIARSFVTEKTTKTAEVILSSVRPLELLLGRILGKGLAGVLQYGIWIGVALGIVMLAGQVIDIALPEMLSPINLMWLLLFFVLGFFLFATLFAMIGVLASDEQNLNQILWPAILLLVVPMIFIWQIFSSPDGLFAVVLSFVPFTAPIVMLVRVLLDTSLSSAEIVLGLVSIILTIGLTLWLASRFFSSSRLMSTRKAKLSDLFKRSA